MVSLQSGHEVSLNWEIFLLIWEAAEETTRGLVVPGIYTVLPKAAQVFPGSPEPDFSHSSAETTGCISFIYKTLFKIVFIKGK